MTYLQRKLTLAQQATQSAIDKKPELGTAVVTAVTTGPSAVTIKLNGSIHTIPGVRYLDSYASPTVNDVVRVLIWGSDIFVLGRQKA